MANAIVLDPTVRNKKMDYRSPFVRVIINRIDGSKYPLWTNIGLTPEQQQNVNLTLRSLAYVQDVSVEIQSAYLPIMKIKCVFPYKEGIAFLNSKLIEWGYSTVEVIFGYTGGAPEGAVFAGNESTGKISPKFEGVLLQPEINIDPNGVEITLNAQGVGGFSASGTTRTDGPYVGKRINLLTDIFVPGPKKDRRLNIDFSLVNGVKKYDKKAWHALNEVVEVSPSGKTDWNIIFELLSESNCWMVLLEDTIRVYPKSILASPVSRVFRSYDFQQGNVSSGNGVYPIMKFNSNAPHIYMPSEAIAFYSQDLSSANPKEVLQKYTDHVTGKTEASGKNPIAPAPSKVSVSPNGNDGIGFFVGSPEIPQWVAQMEQDLRASSQYYGMKAVIDTLGIPDLLPLETIAIRGFGERIDNDNYTIFKIFHNLGISGFTTSFEIFKNVNSAIPVESLAAPFPTGATSPHELPVGVDPNKIYAGESVEKLKKKLQKQKQIDQIKTNLTSKNKNLKGQALDNEVNQELNRIALEEIFGKPLK